MNNFEKILAKILLSIVTMLIFQNTTLFSQVQPEWHNRFNSAWGLTDFGRKLRISVDGNIYIGGHSFDEGNSTAVTTLIKYDQSGNTIWQEHSQPGVFDYIEDIVLDSKENLYSVGDYWNGNDFDVLVTKHDRGGNLLWRSTFNGGYWDRARKIDIDSEGSVYICGHTWYQPEFYNILLVKFDSAGQYIWNRTYTSEGQHSDFGHTLKIDQSNFIYVSGYTMQDHVLLKYSSNGDTLWQKSFNTNKEWMDIEQSHMELDNQNNIIICGNFYSQASQEDILVLKYDHIGNLLWNKKWNSQGNNRDMVSFQASTDNAIATDQNGNIFVSGTMENPGISFGEDIVTLKYNPEGVLQWQHIYDGPANDWDNPLSVTVDRFGDVYVCGFTVEIVNSLVPEDYLTFKLNGNTGTLLWKEIFNGIGNFSDRAYSIGVDEDLNVYVTGITSNDNSISSSNRDIITIKYSQTIVGITANSEIPGTFQLHQNFPNPFNPQTTIAFDIAKETRVTLKVYDLIGREVSTLINENMKPGNYSVKFDGRNLPSGLYISKLTTLEGIAITRRMMLLK
ncbi:MAG: T9SS type A sorting domain-containing protein [Ignavibacteria bacterium]|nr:T9SS type A sorting domain-containing protein [Ignavibacteria bacterium]